MNTSFKLKSVLLAAALGLLLAAPARAQSTVSTFSVPISGFAPGINEQVKFSGTVLLTATVVTDPTLPPQVVLGVAGDNITAVGQTSGASYDNECVANLTRPFAASDAVHLSFAFFRSSTTGAYLQARPAVLNLSLKYDTTTMALTSATGSVLSVSSAQPQPVPVAASVPSSTK